MKIAIGADHGGVHLKLQIKEYLTKHANGYEVIECGNTLFEHLDDFHVFAHKVAETVANKEADRGILVCTTGAGMYITANKHEGIRCGYGFDPVQIEQLRKHLDINVLALGAVYIDEDHVNEIIDAFLEIEAEPGANGKYAKRREMIEPGNYYKDKDQNK
jgi:ribose 5-phosphate isomerase B